MAIERRFRTPPAPGRPAPRAAAPSFSVIVAAYQAADVIGEALDSAFEQTLAPHEVVVCDDGSTDGLDRALAPYRDRITLLRQRNQGEGAAKNAAARAATGEFVVILDADDVFLPERLEALAALASARPDLDVLTTDACVERNGRVLCRYHELVGAFPVQRQREGVISNGSAVFGLAAVRRERLLDVGGFDATMPIVADWELWLRLVLSGSQIGLVDEPLARYRIGDDSLTADRVREALGYVAALERALAHATTPEDRALVEESLELHRRRSLLIEAERALRYGLPEARRLALRVARAPGLELRSRLKAGLSAAAPSVARGFLGRREQTTGRSRLLRTLPDA